MRKHQQEAYLFDITTEKGDKINKLLMSDWREIHEGLLGKKSSTTTFGTKHPTKDNLSLWGQELSKINTPKIKLLSPLNRWLHPSVHVWRHYFDKDKDEV